MNYRHEIDGLRSFAIGAVLLFHAAPSFLVGGYLGVDIFFVISGYLITGVIIESHQNGNFKFWLFLERRIRRIIPALAVMLIVFIPVFVATIAPFSSGQLSKAILSVIFFFSNIHFWSNTGYFSDDTKYDPLLHTWSLSVEEQYYIIFPLLFVLLLKILNRKYLILTTVFFILLGLFLAQYLSLTRPNISFFVILTRGWEFLAGTLAFILYKNQLLDFRIKRLNEFLSGASFFVILLSFAYIGPYLSHPGFITALPVFSTLLILANHKNSVLFISFLQTRILTSLGLISYSVYLYHQPLFSTYRNFFGVNLNFFEILCLTGASIFAGFLSFKYIEKPFRSAKIIGRAKFFLLLSISYTLIIFLALMISRNSERVENIWKNYQSKSSITAYEFVKRNSGALEDLGFRNFNKKYESECNAMFDKVSAIEGSWLDKCFEKYGPAIIVLGDSHAINFYRIVISSEPQNFVIGMAHGGCRLGLSSCTYYTDLEKFISKNQEKVAGVIYHQRGGYLLASSSSRPATFELDATPNNKPRNLLHTSFEEINTVKIYLEKLSRNTSVIWLGSRVEPRIAKKTMIKRGCNSQWDVAESLKETFNKLDNDIANILDNNSPVRYLSFIDRYRVDFSQDFMNCSNLFWRDETHLSLDGILLLSKRYKIISDNKLFFR